MVNGKVVGEGGWRREMEWVRWEDGRSGMG
jgi:hypothetical protein